MVADRIPCINPRCKRTASRERHPDWDEMCCGKCWRLLPVSLTRRYKHIARRYRKLARIESRLTVGTVAHAKVANRLGPLVQRLQDQNWAAIRAFFRPTEKPAGLDTFLEEIGFDAPRS